VCATQRRSRLISSGADEATTIGDISSDGRGVTPTTGDDSSGMDEGAMIVTTHGRSDDAATS
jgi:hypothetical protein